MSCIKMGLSGIDGDMTDVVMIRCVFVSSVIVPAYVIFSLLLLAVYVCVGTATVLVDGNA